MEFRFTPQQIAFRQEVRDFCQKEFPPEVLKRAYRGSPGGYHSAEIKKKFVDKGWYVVHWPKELGGCGLTPIELTTFHEEIGYHYVTAQAQITMAENIRVFGSEQQKQYFLPRFARGEIDFILGISEPNVGVDAANIQCRADPVGDHWVLNGRKMWGGSGLPGAMKTAWSWLIVRTDQNLPRHRGLSIIMVDMNTPGIEVRPVNVMGSDKRLGDKESPVAAVFYDNVKIPKENLLGEVNKGWYQLMAGLDVLRSSMAAGYLGEAHRCLDDTVMYLKTIKGSDRWVADSQVIRHRVAELSADIQVLWNLSYHIASLEEKGADNEAGLVPLSHLASLSKIWSTELVQRVSAFAVQVLGSYGLLMRPESDKWLPFMISDQYNWMSRYTRQLTIGGGSVEMMRTQVAQRNLTLPR